MSCESNPLMTYRSFLFFIKLDFPGTLWSGKVYHLFCTCVLKDCVIVLVIKCCGIHLQNARYHEFYLRLKEKENKILSPDFTNHIDLVSWFRHLAIIYTCYHFN